MVLFDAYNTQAIFAGHILVGAVRMAGITEDNKAKSMERHAIKFIRGIMNLAGVEGEVRITHKTLDDDEAVMRMLTMATNWHEDSPIFEEAVRAAPVFQGRADNIIEAAQMQKLGLDVDT